MREKYKKKKVIYQNHHLCYDPELALRVRRSMHFYLTRVNRFNGMTANEKRAWRYLLNDKPTITEQELHEQKK